MTTATDRLAETIEVARQWASLLIPVRMVYPNSKAPVLMPDGETVWTIHDPDDVPVVLQQVWRRDGPVGLSMALLPESQIVVIDVDEDTPEGKQFLRDHGLGPDLATWICRTPKGGFHIHLYWPSDYPPPPKRVVKVGKRPKTRTRDAVPGLPIDLLCNGQSASPPTQGYTWLPGRSPADIHIGELANIPDALRKRWVEEPALYEQWRDADRQQYQDTGEPFQERRWREILAQSVPEGQRNETAAQVAGFLHRFYSESIALSLFEQWNQQCCTPPMHKRELHTTWHSIARKDGYQPGKGAIDLSVQVEA